MFDFDKSTGEIFLYDEIGPSFWGMIDGGAMRMALNELGSETPVTLRINSPGGSVDQAIAIYNMLRRHPAGVNVAVDSLAASAASYIAIAGDSVTIAENGMFMLHAPLMMAIGNAKELRESANMLDKYQECIEGAYQARMGLDEQGIKDLLGGETWYTAKEAVEAGLADSIEGQAQMTVKIAEGRFQNTPTAYLEKPQPGARTKVDHVMNRLEFVSRRYSTRK